MAKIPKISVIIPTYNRANLVSRAIKSVLDQNYTDFELIIVDDGSSDNTEEVVSSFGDPRIEYVKHTQNRGVSAARNTGIGIAKGHFIAFQDSDDEWLPNKLDKQMSIFEEDRNNKIGVVLCEVYYQDRRWVFKPEINRLTFEDLIFEGTVGPQAYLLRKDLIGSELYFNENLPALEDWDFLLRVSRICRIDYVREILVNYYDHQGPRVYSSNNLIRARNILFRKYAEEFKTRPKALNFHHHNNALDYYQLRQMKLMRHSLKLAIKVYPRIPSQYLHFAISFSGYQGFKYYLGLKRLIKALLKQMNSFLMKPSKIIKS